MRTFIHTPVLLQEVLEGLAPGDGKRHFDGTVGGGGHAEAVLEASGPKGTLIGFDRDEAALSAARERLSRFGKRCELIHANFADILKYVSPESCDSALLDLGVSSPQLDWADRGFSFQGDGPLDMRMDQTEEITAAEIVNEWPAEDLANLFFEYGGERQSRKLARAIETRRKMRRFTTTADLANFIAEELPRGNQRIHPATKAFQALRIEVNQELASLEEGLEGTWAALKPGGRLCVITFHSLEDKIVKNFGRELARDYEVQGEVDLPDFRTERAPKAKLISRKAIQPTELETRENPRARSAQLRVMEKL